MVFMGYWEASDGISSFEMDLDPYFTTNVLEIFT